MRRHFWFKHFILIIATMTDLINNKKIDLALSGGGFRAAIFHLGVLV